MNRSLPHTHGILLQMLQTVLCSVNVVLIGPFNGLVLLTELCPGDELMILTSHP